jgi:Type II CAAX prenyl endopeptidase Rce1-like
LSSSKARALTQPASEATVSKSSSKTNWLYFFDGIILFTVAMMVLSFPIGLYTVFETNISSTYSASTPVHALVYDFLFARVPVPISSNLGGVFVVFLLIYMGFFVFAAKQGAGLSGSLRAAISGGYEALFSNPLVATLVLLGASSLVTITLDTLQSNGGIATGSLTGDPFSLLIDFTVAPLLEETTFRLIMLGVPVLILSLVLLRDFSPLTAAKVLWRPSSAWDVDETDGLETRRSFADSDPAIFPGYSSDSLKARAMRPVVFVFLALSSIIFGYAHFASGSGWGPGKISEAALAGLALGYLYIKYGFHTSVLLHWSINYAGSIYSFFGQGVYGVPWTSNTGSLLDIVPSLDFVLLLGVPSTLILVNELLKRSLGGRRTAPGPGQTH